MGGLFALVDFSTSVLDGAIALVAIRASAFVASVKVLAIGGSVADALNGIALVHVDGAGGSGPVQLSVGGGTDTRIVTGPGLLLALAAVLAGVGVAVVCRRGGGSGRPRRRGLRRGGGEGRGRTG